jgi:hypothetical protein
MGKSGKEGRGGEKEWVLKSYYRLSDKSIFSAK